MGDERKSRSSKKDRRRGKLPAVLDQPLLEREIRNGMRVRDIVNVPERKPDHLRPKIQERFLERPIDVLFEAEIEALNILSFGFKSC